jgi:predicted  nucleic acid-binding Zn-ribbon protein
MVTRLDVNEIERLTKVMALHEQDLKTKVKMQEDITSNRTRKADLQEDIKDLKTKVRDVRAELKK